jgi:leukotriene A-4 hydrolase/aminopeptidase
MLASCSAPENDMTHDPHSFARPAEARVKHMHLDLTVDFDTKTLSGSAKLDIEKDPEAKEIHLDVRDLRIKEMTLLPSGDPAHFTLHDPQPFLGSDLAILLNPGTESILIEYSTDPSAGALQWLEPSQTAGKKDPFLFTQSQAILARTWVPCQDGPGVRMTYTATIKTRPGLLAVMSASNPTELSEDGSYSFEMKQPIPSYLLALAVGDIAFAPLGPRSGVYAEPSVLEKAAYEFEDTEKMMEAAEELYGAYRWDRYDIIVLPPSFPFGGMENPRLTFATPTILAGDKSLVSLVAHELAHSWSGNLVTNATWDDFWLNEGFTTYFEMRIMESLYGREYSEMLARLAMQDLEGTVSSLGADHPDTRLAIELTGRDPDEGMTDIAYNKGAFFLRHCEETVGRDAWDAFLKKYFDQFAFTSMTTDIFVGYLREHLIAGDDVLDEKLSIDTWIYGKGIPEKVPVIASDEFRKVEDKIRAISGDILPSLEETGSWTTHHWLHFIRNLPADIDVQGLRALDKSFRFTQSGNSEILSAWLLTSIRAGYTDSYGALEKFLTSQGRRKFLQPLYQELAKTTDGMKLAKKIYAKARSGYHSVSSNTIDGIVGVKD